MLIGQLGKGHRPVIENSSSAIESHIFDLANGLIATGNDVLLYGAPGSAVEGAREFDLAGLGSNDPDILNSLLADKALKASGYQMLDVLHNHQLLVPERLDDWAAVNKSTPVVSVLHTDPPAEYVNNVQTYWPAMPLVAFTEAQANRLPLHWVGVVNHGVDTKMFTPNNPQETPDAHALVIGRILAGKNTHTAIKAALKAGLPVEVAGKIVDADYYTQQVGSLIYNEAVTMRHSIVGEEKRQAYADAAVMICASTLAETFCLVLAEAMACGTPVVALNNGSSAEVVDEGVSGYVVDSEEDLPEAIEAAMLLDRDLVRKCAVARFSIDRMAQEYLAIYKSL